ncbi:flagellar hook-length control protein FliK [Sanguibacter hominis ATCC BAA-789]|uniref:Flagellar hook-length control protein FliK n=1 Tax=Sanguibacter hominis ATCC BAA-789 TaxID=1312740 RepID=A0A9X5FGA1_9MICO|nr:flagellar hook-length control protein FliK [Sanguibacter hominis]NKX93556.1 flagellar hook-length control protein FliK [Sanguibacter hominis ATCC BAA-789]
MTVQISVVDLRAARPAVPAPAAARTDDAFARTLDRATQDRQPADGAVSARREDRAQAERALADRAQLARTQERAQADRSRAERARTTRADAARADAARADAARDGSRAARGTSSRDEVRPQAEHDDAAVTDDTTTQAASDQAPTAPVADVETPVVPVVVGTGLTEPTQQPLAEAGAEVSAVEATPVAPADETAQPVAAAAPAAAQAATPVVAAATVAAPAVDEPQAPVADGTRAAAALQRSAALGSSTAAQPAGQAAPLTQDATPQRVEPAAQQQVATATPQPDAAAAAPAVAAMRPAGVEQTTGRALPEGFTPVGATAAASPTPQAAPTAPAAAPAAPARTEAPPLAEQLRAPLARLRALPAGDHMLTLRVEPKALGPVEVRAHIGADGVRIELVGGTDAARESLRGILPELRRDLAATGMQAQLDLGSGRSDSQGAQQGSGLDTDGGRGSGRPEAARGDARGTSVDTASAPAPRPDILPTDGRSGVDVLA